MQKNKGACPAGQTPLAVEICMYMKVGDYMLANPQPFMLMGTALTAAACRMEPS